MLILFSLRMRWETQRMIAFLLVGLHVHWSSFVIAFMTVSHHFQLTHPRVYDNWWTKEFFLSLWKQAIDKKGVCLGILLNMLRKPVLWGELFDHFTKQFSRVYDNWWTKEVVFFKSVKTIASYWQKRCLSWDFADLVEQTSSLGRTFWSFYKTVFPELWSHELHS